jgi:hypothetical protein
MNRLKMVRFATDAGYLIVVHDLDAGIVKKCSGWNMKLLPKELTTLYLKKQTSPNGMNFGFNGKGQNRKGLTN